MKSKKLVVAEKKELVPVIHGARVISPVVSKSHGVQKRHMRKYDSHLTLINPQRTSRTMIMRPAIERTSIRLPGPTVQLPPVINSKVSPEIKLLDDANQAYLIGVIDDILNHPWNYITRPEHNIKEWNELVMTDVIPKIATVKGSWDKISVKSGDAVFQVAQFIDNIMGEANAMSKVLDKRRISFAKQKRLEEKIVKLYTDEWSHNSETVIPLDIADYFLELFRAYWDGDITKDQVNVELGGDLWDIEAKIGEDL